MCRGFIFNRTPDLFFFTLITVNSTVYGSFDAGHYNLPLRLDVGDVGYCPLDWENMTPAMMKPFLRSNEVDQQTMYILGGAVGIILLLIIGGVIITCRCKKSEQKHSQAAFRSLELGQIGGGRDQHRDAPGRQRGRESGAMVPPAYATGRSDPTRSAGTAVPRDYTTGWSDQSREGREGTDLSGYYNDPVDDPGAAVPRDYTTGWSDQTREGREGTDLSGYNDDPVDDTSYYDMDPDYPEPYEYSNSEYSNTSEPEILDYIESSVTEENSSSSDEENSSSSSSD